MAAASRARHEVPTAPMNKIDRLVGSTRFRACEHTPGAHQAAAFAGREPFRWASMSPRPRMVGTMRLVCATDTAELVLAS